MSSFDDWLARVEAEERKRQASKEQAEREAKEAEAAQSGRASNAFQTWTQVKASRETAVHVRATCIAAVRVDPTEVFLGCGVCLLLHCRHSKGVSSRGWTRSQESLTQLMVW